MLPRNAIQKLQDSQLIRIFLDFVQTYHLQYEKINKEISYKCHEATWVLATTKATGYGRTQSEAYKHALRNLLEILVEDDNYADFFQSIFSGEHEPQSRNSYSGVPQDHGSSKKNHLKTHCFAQQNQHVSSKNKRIRQNKTEAYELEYNQDAGQAYPQYSHQYLPPSYPKNISKEPKSNYETNNLTKNQHTTSSASKLNTLYSNSKKLYTEQSQYNSTNKQKQVHHSKINLNILTASNVSNPKSSSENKTKVSGLESQLHQAKQRMAQLQQQLAAITSQNNILRQRIEMENMVAIKNGQQKQKIVSSGSIHPVKSIQNQNPMRKSVKQNQNMSDTSFMKDQTKIQNGNCNNKVHIPKLKLQILPNYHKKSQKSLNQSLLAVYNQKHGGSKKLI